MAPIGLGVGIGAAPDISTSGFGACCEAPSSLSVLCKGTVGGIVPIPMSPSLSTRWPSSLCRSVASALPSRISKLPIVFFDWSWSASSFPWLRTALSSAIPPRQCSFDLLCQHSDLAACRTGASMRLFGPAVAFFFGGGVFRLLIPFLLDRLTAIYIYLSLSSSISKKKSEN